MLLIKYLKKDNLNIKFSQYYLNTILICMNILLIFLCKTFYYAVQLCNFFSSAISLFLQLCNFFGSAISLALLFLFFFQVNFQSTRLLFSSIMKRESRMRGNRARTVRWELSRISKDGLVTQLLSLGAVFGVFAGFYY